MLAGRSWYCRVQEGMEGSKIGMKTRDDSDALMRQAMANGIERQLGCSCLSLDLDSRPLDMITASTHLLGRTNAPSFLINFDSGSHSRV